MVKLLVGYRRRDPMQSSRLSRKGMNDSSRHVSSMTFGHRHENCQVIGLIHELSRLLLMRSTFSFLTYKSSARIWKLNGSKE